MYLINTPWIFRSVWAVIKPWLGERTQSKITLLGADYKEELLKHIDADKLPAEYGGTCTCNATGGCFAEPGEGPWNPVHSH